MEHQPDFSDMDEAIETALLDVSKKQKAVILRPLTTGVEDKRTGIKFMLLNLFNEWSQTEDAEIEPFDVINNIEKAKKRYDSASVEESSFKDLLMTCDYKLYKSSPKEKHMERINTTKLQWVISNLQESNEQEAKDLSVYLKRCNADGYATTTYAHSRGLFRKVACGPVSLQRMKSDIRNCISGEFYNDIDIINCGPTILRWLISVHYPKMKMTALTRYCDIKNRENILDEICRANDTMCTERGNAVTPYTRDNAKSMISAIINGGRLSYTNSAKTQWLQDFYKEVSHISDTMPKNKYPALLRLAKSKRVKEAKAFALRAGREFDETRELFGAEGGTMAWILQFHENRALTAAQKYFDNLMEIKHRVLCFDGLQLPKDVPVDIDALELFVFTETGIPLKYKIKDMKSSIVVPDNIDEYVKPDNSAELAYLKSQHTDEDLATYFMARYGCSVVYSIVESSLYLYNGVYWKKDTSDSTLQNMVGNEVYHRLLEHVAEADTEGDGALLKHLSKLRNWGSRSGAIKTIISRIRRDGNLFDTDEKLLGFTNGVWDLSTSTFRPSTPHDMISLVVPYDWVEPSKEDITEFETTFLHKVLPIPDEREIFLQVLASGLEAYALSNITFLTSLGRNGKDTILTSLVPAAFGNDLYYNGPKDWLLANSRGSDTGAQQAVANMNKKRLIVYNEPSVSDILSNSRLKEIRGCPEFQARGLWATNTRTMNHGTHILICNGAPKVDGVDPALASTLLIIPFRSRFLTSDEIDLEPDSKHVYTVDLKFKTKEWLSNAKLPFMSIVLKAHARFRAAGRVISNVPESMKSLAKSYMADSNPMYNWFIDNYKLTEEKKEKKDIDYLQLSDVYDNFKTSDLWCDMPKSQRRACNKSKFVESVELNPQMRKYYKARHWTRPLEGNKDGLWVRNVLVGWSIIYA